MSLLEYFHITIEKFLTLLRDLTPNENNIEYNIECKNIPEECDVEFLCLCLNTKFLNIGTNKKEVYILYNHEDIMFHDYIKELPKETYNFLYRNICYTRWVKIGNMYQTLCFNLLHNRIFTFLIQELKKRDNINIEIVPNGMYFKTKIHDMENVQKYLPLEISHEYD